MNDSFLTETGQPDVSALQQTFNRCGTPFAGGVDWLDQVRDCNGPEDSADGRKHADPNNPESEAFPWENASNCKPYTADDVINELTAMDLAGFWRAMVQRGAGQSDASGYAVALVEHLVFGPMMAQLDKETELSAQHRHSRGWCLLAPRWRTEFGLKRYELKEQDLLALAQQAPEGHPLRELPAAIADPTREEFAMDLLRQWYQGYINAELPEKFQDRAPKMRDATLRRAVRELRSERKTTAPIPYICRNEAEIVTLEPYREVLIPNELTDTQQIVYQIEYLTPEQLEARILGEGYDPQWVAAAKKQSGSVSLAQLPVRSQLLGLGRLLSHPGRVNTTQPSTSTGDERTKLVEVIHAVYMATDADGVPGAYCTTFHRNIKGSPGVPEFAKHELVEDIAGKLPYVALVREWRTRAITSSRSVVEMVCTDQKLIKDTFDQTIDRASITILPPVNVYESPSGMKYEFGPAVQNFVRQGKEPQFMQMPTNTGLADGMEVYAAVRKKVDNRFGLMSEDVPPSRMQAIQERNTRRFLIAWTQAFQQVLALWQKHGDDKQFSAITGAPEGWLQEQRNTPGLLSSIFDFDVRELDSETFIKQVEAMDNSVIPMDTMNVVDRAAYTAWKSRGIVGPRVARMFLRSLPAAATALRDKVEVQVLKMFSGQPPLLVDKDDPAAAGMLDLTRETVLANPKFTAALTPEGLQAVAGEQTQSVLLNMRQAGITPRPDALFSALLENWIKNLTFIGVTQQRNKQIGRQGVDGGQPNG